MKCNKTCINAWLPVWLLGLPSVDRATPRRTSARRLGRIGHRNTADGRWRHKYDMSIAFVVSWLAQVDQSQQPPVVSCPDATVSSVVHVVGPPRIRVLDLAAVVQSMSTRRDHGRQLVAVAGLVVYGVHEQPVQLCRLE